MYKTIVRISAALVAAGFLADATYALYSGAALNSGPIMMDLLGLSVATLLGLIVPVFIPASEVKDLFDFEPKEEEVMPEDHDDSCDLYSLIDAIRLLGDLPCVTAEQRSTLGDIAKTLITGGKDSCDV